MKLLTKEQMGKLTTARLLAYRNSLLSVVETGRHFQDDYVYFAKDSPTWKRTYKQLKEVLATREHVQ